MAASWVNRIVEYGEESPDQILAHPKNFRTHPKHQQDALAGVLRDVGVVQDVIVNRRTGFLLDGHLRVSLALREGQATIPVKYVDLSEAEEALVLATLDPIAAMATVDAAKLDELLREVSTGDAAVQAMLDALAVDAGIVPGLGNTDDDAPVEIDESGPTRCQPGDVWQLGRHTVACLSSTEQANIEAVVAGQTVQMVWADPPYGINFDPTKERGKLAPSISRPHVIGDDSIDTAVLASSICLKIHRDAVHFWWGANNYAHTLPPSTCWIVWDKENGANDFADIELCWTNTKGAARLFRHMWNGMLKDSERGEQRVHPTQKPVALCAWAFDKYGASGDVILDPFLGSGPSLKAAEHSNRTVIGFELSPHYCDHIIAWWEAETGQTAEKIG